MSASDKPEEAELDRHENAAVISEFAPRRLRQHSAINSHTSGEDIRSLLQRVSGHSVHEIDRLIEELTGLRHMLDKEGARVHRQIMEYATMSQSAMQSTKVISEGLAQWRRVSNTF
jgi:hypothetical protein